MVILCIDLKSIAAKRLLLSQKNRNKIDSGFGKSSVFSASPKFELAMLERRFYLAFINVGNTFGCPDAMKHWDEFYMVLTGKYLFSKRTVLLALSRGRRYVYNWAAKNADKVSCIYAGNAVCDFKSWSGGIGEGPGSAENWSKLMEDYNFASEQEALDYSGNPIGNLEPPAGERIPLIHVSATDDEIVPIAENTDIVEKRYKRLGGRIKVFRHSGKHHPHGLGNPEPIIDFILENGKGLK